LRGKSPGQVKVKLKTLTFFKFPKKSKFEDFFFVILIHKRAPTAQKRVKGVSINKIAVWNLKKASKCVSKSPLEKFKVMTGLLGDLT
jgi:hypothetical protein